MPTLEEELAAEAADLKAIPTEAGSARLRKLGLELMDVDRRLEDAEALAKKLAERRNQIMMKDMPALMQEVGQDKIGLPDAGVDLELKPYFHANIAADWEPEKREAAFNYLRDQDAEAIIQSVMSVAAGRGDDEKMQRLIQRVTQMLAELELAANITVGQSVPWNTLTAWLKGQIQTGKIVDLEVLGATVGHTVKIKKRKES